MSGDDRVTVTGRATRTLVPDRAAWRAEAEAVDEIGAAALEACGASARAMIAAVTASGVEAETTTGHSGLGRNFDDRTGEARGFVATVEVHVEVAVEDAGAMAQVLLDAGAAELGGPKIWSSRVEELRTELLGAAVDDARAKAERIANAARRGLGAVVAVEEPQAGRDGGWAEQSSKLSRRAASVGVPVEPGRHEVAVALRVTFALS